MHFYGYFNWDKCVVNSFLNKFKSTIFYQFNLIRVKAANNFLLILNYLSNILLFCDSVYHVCVLIKNMIQFRPSFVCVCVFFCFCFSFSSEFRMVFSTFYLCISLSAPNLNFINRYFIFQTQWSSVCCVNKHHLCTN